MTRRFQQGSCAAPVAIAALLSPALSHAAGYDQPVPFTARNIGVGGTAVAAADDPTAPAYNPAGLAWVSGAEVLGGVTLMMGKLRASPESDINVESERIVAPLPFLSAASKLFDRVHVGLAMHPIAAAGAVYEYEGAVGLTRDETRAAFVEAALGVGVRLPLGLALGIAHRTTYATLSRYKRGANASGPGIELNLDGIDFTGVRLGAQWHALQDAPHATAATRRRLRFGVAYRHPIEIDVHGETGTVFSQPASDTTTTLRLPARLTGGIRLDFGRFGAAFEADYVNNAANDKAAVRAKLAGAALDVPAIFDWQDAVTLRAGAEYRTLSDGELALRIGFARDGTSASRTYPIPFGPPPAPTHVATLGAGFSRKSWSMNLGYGLRFGETTINESELGRDACAFCGYSGEYSTQLHLISADFSRRFD